MSDDEKTILIVDDEEVVAESYELYLEGDYETRIATTGGAALAELNPNDREVDLILLDRRMPGMSGDVVAEHVADYELDYQVIMVSAVDPDVDVATMPCDGYLSKPVSEDEVVEAVEKALNVDRYQTLLKEYNAVAEKQAILSEEFKSTEVPDELRDLRSRKDELESEIEAVVAELDDTNVGGAFDIST